MGAGRAARLDLKWNYVSPGIFNQEINLSPLAVHVVEQITPASSKRLGEHVLEHESEIERAIIAVQTARHRNVVATRQHPRVRLIQLEVPRVFRGLERPLRIAYHVAFQADMGRN